MAARKRATKLTGLRAIAAAYGVSPSTAHRWLSTGALPSRDVGGKLVATKIPREQITAGLATARAARVEQRAAEKVARTRMFGGEKQARRERELGIMPAPIERADLAALSITIFAASGETAEFSQHVRRVRDEVLAAISRGVAGDRVTYRGDLWRGHIVFPRNVSEQEIRRALARVKLTKKMLRGGRLNFCVYTDRGVQIPISYAYSSPKAALAYALATLDRGAVMLGDSPKNRSAVGQRSADQRKRWRDKKARQRARGVNTKARQKKGSK